MLNYTFSKREKVLLLVLAAILVLLAWYLFVWQAAAAQRQAIDADIAEAQAQTIVANNRLASMDSMQSAIAERKAAGVAPVQLPDFDNTTALMAQLNTVLASTVDYKLTFDDLDRSAEGIVARGVTITFGCESIDAARNVMAQLEQGPFVCAVDASSIVSTNAADNRNANARVGVGTYRNVAAPYAVGLHAVFYEKA